MQTKTCLLNSWVLGFAVSGFLIVETQIIAAEPTRYAVLVGVEDYFHPEFCRPQKLQYCVEDATEFAEILSAKAFGYQVTLLTDDTGKNDERLLPTKERIEAVIEEISKKALPGDTVLIAFSGHGVEFSELNDAYFCPIDARPGKENALKTLVSIKGVYSLLKDSFATTRVVLVDACRSEERDPRKGGKGVSADSLPVASQRRGCAVQLSFG